MPEAALVTAVAVPYRHTPPTRVSLTVIHARLSVQLCREPLLARCTVCALACGCGHCPLRCVRGTARERTLRRGAAPYGSAS